MTLINDPLHHQHLFFFSFHNYCYIGQVIDHQHLHNHLYDHHYPHNSDQHDDDEDAFEDLGPNSGHFRFSRTHCMTNKGAKHSTLFCMVTMMMVMVAMMVMMVMMMMMAFRHIPNMTNPTMMGIFE